MQRVAVSPAEDGWSWAVFESREWKAYQYKTERQERCIAVGWSETEELARIAAGRV